MYGIQSLGYLGPKIWNIVPKELRQIDTIEKFKIDIKKWNPKGCPCKLCKTYLYGVGYVKSCPCKLCKTYLYGVGYVKSCPCKLCKTYLYGVGYVKSCPCKLCKTYLHGVGYVKSAI